jgi:hypothetical protein
LDALLVIGGAFLQYELVVKVGRMVVIDDAAAAGRNFALTSTGMIAPVARLKGRWPSTLRSEAISPKVKKVSVPGLDLPLCL